MVLWFFFVHSLFRGNRCQLRISEHSLHIRSNFLTTILIDLCPQIWNWITPLSHKTILCFHPSAFLSVSLMHRAGSPGANLFVLIWGAHWNLGSFINWKQNSTLDTITQYKDREWWITSCQIFSHNNDIYYFKYTCLQLHLILRESHSISLSVCLSDCLSASLPACLSVCLSVSQSVSLSVCLSVCQSVSQSVGLLIRIHR